MSATRFDRVPASELTTEELMVRARVRSARINARLRRLAEMGDQA